MKLTSDIPCPICKKGLITISEWDFPETRDEPRDCGYEIDKQTCDCDYESEENSLILWDSMNGKHIDPEYQKIQDCHDNFVPNGQCYCGFHKRWNGKVNELIPYPEEQLMESIPIFSNNGDMTAILSLADPHDPNIAMHDYLFDVVGIINPYYMSSKMLIEKLEKLGFGIEQEEQIDNETFFNASSKKMGYFFSVWSKNGQKELLLQILNYWFSSRKIMPNSFWSNTDYKPIFEIWMIKNRCNICIMGEKGNCFECKADWYATGKKAGYW